MAQAFLNNFGDDLMLPEYDMSNNPPVCVVDPSVDDCQPATKKSKVEVKSKNVPRSSVQKWKSWTKAYLTTKSEDPDELIYNLFGCFDAALERGTNVRVQNFVRDVERMHNEIRDMLKDKPNTNAEVYLQTAQSKYIAQLQATRALIRESV